MDLNTQLTPEEYEAEERKKAADQIGDRFRERQEEYAAADLESKQRLQSSPQQLVAPQQTSAPQQQQATPQQPTAPQPAQPQQQQDYPHKNNALQEVGTAIVGGGIDAMESIGATAEAAVTGQMLNPDFKPTWLQVADEREPMNRTPWGIFLRGIGEYAALNLVLRRGAKGLKAAKVPGAARLSKATTMDPKKAQMKGFKGFKARVTDPKSTIREAAFGAAADFTSSFSEGETLSTEAKKLFRQIPDWLVTQEDDNPLERKMKNVIEGVGMGKVTDILFAWRAAKAMEIELPDGLTDKAALELVETRAAMQNNQMSMARLAERFKPGGKLTPAELSFLRKNNPEFDALYTSVRAQTDVVADMEKKLSPELLAQTKMVNSSEARQKNYDEYAQWRDMQDPEFMNPDGFRNGPVFDQPNKGIFSARGDFLKGLRQQYQMDNDGVLKNGRLPNMYTESALEKRLTQFDPERRVVIEKIAKNLAKQMEGTDEAYGISNDQLKNLSIAKYIDMVDEIAKSDNDVEALKGMLTSDTINIGSEEMKILSMDNHAAVELLVYQTAGEISDLAQAGRSIDGVMDNTRQQDALLNRMEFMLMETAKSKYIAGFRLEALKNMSAELKLPDARTAAKEIAEREKGVKQYIKELKQKWTEDPESVKPWLDALALADGSPQALDQMYKWAKNKVFNWKSLFKGGAENRSAFFDALTSVMYNSILSGPKTLMRAALGNTSMMVMRPISTVLGGLVSGDDRAVAIGFMQMRAGQEAIGEAFKVFGQAWNAGKNNLENIPYVAQQRIPLTMTDEWKALRPILEQNGNSGDMMAYQMTEAIYNFNNFIGVKYPMVTMNAIDSASSVIIARMEAKTAAFAKAWDESAGASNASKNMKELTAKYEKEMIDKIFNRADADDMKITSDRAKYLADEAGLKISLKGKKVPLLGLDLTKAENLIQESPGIRPYFLFMKTGWNALEVIQKHTPILARFNDEYRAVMSATAGDLSKVAPYGIHTPAQLIEAQAMMQGRVAVGYMTVAAAIGLYTNGRLTGNGPHDRETRNAWLATGWSPRSFIYDDNLKISTDSLEPFNTILNIVSDIGDNSNTLGEAATENWFRKVAFLIAQNVTNKSFLAGLGPFGEIMSLDVAQGGVFATNMINNTLPWAGARKELANIFDPGRRELEADFLGRMRDTAMNRNPGLRGELPIQTDLLDGGQVEMWSWPVRIFNSISPVQLSGKDSEVRRKFRESGFDLKLFATTDSLGNKMDRDTKAKWAQIFGSYNVEETILKRIMDDPQFDVEMAEARHRRNLNIPSRTGEGGDRIYGFDITDLPLMGEMKRQLNVMKERAFQELYRMPGNEAMWQDYETKNRTKQAIERGNFKAFDQELLNYGKE